MSLEGYYKVVELESFGGRLKIKERSLRNVAENEVLVKIKYTTINSADFLFLKGDYSNINATIFPVVPGFEGCGEIVKVGAEVDRSFVGKRVSILADLSHPGTFDGLWAEYHYTHLSNLLVFDENFEYEKIISVLNPLTSIGIFDTVRKLKVESFFQTDSPCSRMIYNLCSRDGIKVVNIVKDENSYKSLKAINACNVVKISDLDWEKELHKICLHFKVNTGFSYLSGKAAGDILSAMPSESTLYQFGEMSELNLDGIHSSDLIFDDKVIKGWWVVRWMQALTQDEILYWMNYLQTEIKSNSGVFDPNQIKTFKITELYEAINYYSENANCCNVIIQISK